MNITIYDTEHFETTYTLIKILDPEINSITLFTTPEIYSVLEIMLEEKSKKIKYVIKHENNFAFIFNLYKYCIKNNPTFLFLNTVSYHHLYFGVGCLILKNTKTILTIHAANNFFSPLLKWNIRSLIRWLGKKLLSISVFGYISLLHSTKNYIRKRFTLTKPIYVIPGRLYKHTKILKTSFNDRKIVITGSIDKYRRDYEEVFKLALALEQFELRTEIVLLGTAVGVYGSEIIDRCINFKLKFVKLITYQDLFIQQEEYDNQIKSCDFLFLPLAKGCQKPNEHIEKYGLTLCSGSFFDAVKNGKPILLPNYIFLSEELKQQCIRYNSIDDICEFIRNIDSNEKYKSYADKAINNSLNFTLDKIRKVVFRELKIYTAFTSDKS